MIKNLYEKLKNGLENLGYVFYWKNENSEIPTKLQSKIYFGIKISELLFVNMTSKKQLCDVIFDVTFFCSSRNEKEYLENLTKISQLIETFDSLDFQSANLFLLKDTININYIENEYRFEITVKIRGR